MLRTLVDFCVDHHLLRREDGEHLLCDNERTFRPAMDIILGSVASEQVLYEVFSQESGLELFNVAGFSVSEILKSSYEHKLYDTFSALPVSVSDDIIKVVSWDWGRRAVIARALENVTGKKHELQLVTYSEFQKMKELF